MFSHVSLHDVPLHDVPLHDVPLHSAVARRAVARRAVARRAVARRAVQFCDERDGIFARPPVSSSCVAAPTGTLRRQMQSVALVARFQDLSRSVQTYWFPGEGWD